MPGDQATPSSTEATRALPLIHEGWDHLMHQRPLAAWASWQRALRIDRESQAARGALASLESAEDLPTAARAVWRFRAPATPEQRARWNERIKGRNLEELADAAAVFAALAGDDPDDAHAWFNRGLCLAWLGRNAESIDCLDRVVQLGAGVDPERAAEAWTLAEVLRQGAGAEALADDLRYVWIVPWDDALTPRLRAYASELHEVAAPRHPVTGEPEFADARVFEWLDRPMPAPSPSLTAEELPRVAATAVLAGGSLRLSSPDASVLEQVREPLARVLADRPRPLQRQAVPLPLSLLDAAVWTIRRPRGLAAEIESRLAREAVEHFYEDLWIHRPRQGLGNVSPLEASRAARAGDAVARVRLAAVVRLREQLGARVRTAELYQGYPFDRLRRRLGLEPEDPSATDPADASCMGEDELDRLDLGGLAVDRLADAYRSAAALGDDRRTARMAAALLDAPGTASGDAVNPDLFAVLVRESLRTGDPDVALAWLDRARPTRGGQDRVTYDIWSAEVLARSGEPERAAEVYQELIAAGALRTPLILDAAEDLLSSGFPEHAQPLIDCALERAHYEGDSSTLARARNLAGIDPTEEPAD
jgi:tetratricopeptide (TPR) repeat protein